MKIPDDQNGVQPHDIVIRNTISIRTKTRIKIKPLSNFSSKYMFNANGDSSNEICSKMGRNY